MTSTAKRYSSTALLALLVLEHRFAAKMAQALLAFGLVAAAVLVSPARDDVRGRLRIRVLGIDTPETKKPGFDVACWGPEATEFARSTMLGQRVAMQPDPTQDSTDRYGRTYLH